MLYRLFPHLIQGVNLFSYCKDVSYHGNNSPTINKEKKTIKNENLKTR